MRNRVALVFLVGMLAGAMMFAGGFVMATSFADSAEAQRPETWQVAGGEDGFSIGAWGAGDPATSLDAWVAQLPAECDIVPIQRGVSFVSVLYRCI